MRVLYRVVDRPEDLSNHDKIEKYILRHFYNTNSLFGSTMIANLTGTKRGQVQRRIRKLKKRGFVERWPTK